MLDSRFCGTFENDFDCYLERLPMGRSQRGYEDIMDMKVYMDQLDRFCWNFKEVLWDLREKIMLESRITVTFESDFDCCLEQTAYGSESKRRLGNYVHEFLYGLS